MFPIHPLLPLTDFDEDEFKRGAIRDHPPIQGPDGAYFGHEWARWRHDSFDAAVDQWLAACGRPCIILDIGGATGARAAGLARPGHDVTVVDLVEAPNRRASARVSFRQADIRDLAADQFAMAFDLIHARRVLNFLSLGDVDRFFAFAQAALAPGGLLAISFFAPDVTPEHIRAVSPPGSRPSVPLAAGVLAHHLSAVRCLMDSRDLRITEAFSDNRAEVGLMVQRHDAASSGPRSPSHGRA